MHTSPAPPHITELPVGTEIVVYRRGQYCVFADDAVRIFAENGRHAIRLDDGMLEWRLAGRPVATHPEERVWTNEGHHMTQTDSPADADADWLFTSPRPAPVRCQPAFYPLMAPVEARYSDMDVNGHLNNLALESLHENIRATLNARVNPAIYDPARRSIRLVTSQNIVHFLAEAHWPATIHAGAGVARIGNTSFVVSSALFIDQRCISVCDTVLVAVDADGRPMTIPQQARDAMGQLRVGASG